MRFLFFLLLIGFQAQGQSDIMEWEILFYPDKLIEFTDSLPTQSGITQIEEDLLQSPDFQNSIDSCSYCRMGMYYALGKLYAMAQVEAKSDYYYQRVQPFLNDDRVIANDIPPFPLNTPYHDEEIGKSLYPTRAKDKKGVGNYEFLLGYLFVNQYYICTQAIKYPIYEDFLLNESPQFLFSTLPLFFDIFEPLSPKNHKLVEAFYARADSITDMQSDHTDLNPHIGVIEHHDATSCTGFQEIPLTYFNGNCSHMKHYQKLLLALLSEL